MSIQSEITRLTGQRDAMAAVLEAAPPAGNSLERCGTVLETLRQALASNLTAMGVQAAAGEALEVLVPKVLRIPQGDISAELFLASALPAFDVSYGFFSTGEVAGFSGMCTVSAVCRLTALRLTITGAGAATLALTGAGWTVSKGTDSLAASYAPSGGLTRLEAQAALDGVQIAGDGTNAVTASIQVSAVGESGAVLPASGTTALVYKYQTTWGVLDDMAPTWSELEGQTWSRLERMGKPAG